MLYKRKPLAILLAALLLTATLICGCSKPVKEDKSDEQPFTPYASVNFIDLSFGESVFILFSDGKTMLIDCGRNQEDGDKIIEYIEKFNATIIDYLVLTHPDGEHVGGAERVISELGVRKAFIPKISGDLLSLFPSYHAAVTALEEGEVETIKSQSCKFIKGDDYGVVFLSPVSGDNDPYKEFNLTDSPTQKQADNLSPIIYLYMDGVRFLFTGDALSGQEKAVLDNYECGFYKAFGENVGIEIDLFGLDFLKVSSGGSNGATTSAFAYKLRSENAVVFCGDGRYPENGVIHNLWSANNDYYLWRTDVYGTVSVKIDGKGLYTVITEKEQ